jgi:hypothetical protein
LFEAIAYTRLGDSVAGTGRVGLNLAAKVADVDPQHVRLLQIAYAPDLLEDLGVSQNLAGMGNRCDTVFILKHVRIFKGFAFKESIFGIEKIGFHDYVLLCFHYLPWLDGSREEIKRVSK